MKIRFCFLCALVLALVSCKEEKKEAVDPRLATDSLQIVFQPQRKQQIQLYPNARKATEGWENYPELEAQIAALDTIRLRLLRVNGKEFINTAALAQTKVKDSFANTAIEARLTVLFSKTSTLIEQASKITVDTAAVNKEATELYNSFQNLKLQINLKFQKSIEELLEQYEIEADSLSAVRDTTQQKRKEVLRANRVPTNK